MLNVSAKIIEKAKEMGFEVDNKSYSNAVKFLTRRGVVKLLGTDIIKDEDMDLEPVNGVINLNFVSGETLIVSANETGINFSYGKCRTSITKNSDESGISSSFTYYDKDKLVVDGIGVVNEELSYMRNIDGQLDISVEARPVGAIKSGKALYELVKIYPIEEEKSFLKRIANAVTGDSFVSIEEDIEGKSYDNYVDLFDAMNRKFVLDSRYEKKRVLNK